MYVNGFSYLDPLVDMDGEPLTAGGSENGDGAIFQVGYFDGVSPMLDPADYGDAEWEGFRPLTGIGSPNAVRHPTSIGGVDSGATGPFGFLWYPSPVAIELDPDRDKGLPLEFPARLGVRFYDGTSMEESTAFNTVTSDDLQWLLHLPEPAPASNSVLDMDAHALFWASGVDGAFQTAILFEHMPEPGSTSLVLVGALVLMRRRRGAD